VRAKHVPSLSLHSHAPHSHVSRERIVTHIHQR
jgi:hypothetical protein